MNQRTYKLCKGLPHSQASMEAILCLTTALQTEKQRIIWAYKILFLDVLFPLGLKKVIFCDSDQVIRGDMAELWDMDLQVNSRCCRLTARHHACCCLPQGCRRTMAKLECYP